jgi:lysophospholipase L1-like esterase
MFRPSFFVWLLAAVIGIFVLQEVRQLRTKLAHSARLVENAVPFSVSLPGASRRILIAGDSTAVGTGAENPNQSIGGRIAADVPDAAIMNIGISGLRTGQLLAQLKKLSGQHFDIVLLQIGGNDIIRFTNLEELEHSLGTVLAYAGSLGGRVIVMTSGDVGAAPFFPRPLRWLYARRTIAVRDVFIRQTAKHGAAYVDLYVPRADNPFAQFPDRYYSPDGLHPSGAGYGLWYEKLRPVILN